MNKQSILHYWHDVEFLSPQKIPRTARHDKSTPVFSVDISKEPPWSPEHELKNRKLPEDKVWRHTVYCGIYEVVEVRDILKKVYKGDLEVFDERVDGETAVFSITLAHEGHLLAGSFVLSTSAWALGQLIKSNTLSKNWINEFDSASRRISRHLEGTLAISNGSDKEEGSSQEGYSAGYAISVSELLDAIDYVISELGISQLKVSRYLRVKSFQVRKSKADKERTTPIEDKSIHTADDSDFLNSFFLKDLWNISNEVSNGNYGRALKDYLLEDNEIDNNKRKDVRQKETLLSMFHMLSPDRFPTGRWPASGHHPLFYAQQFAINRIADTLFDKTGIFAVNGPPGTGKTTLLRDLVSAIIVERAKKLSELSAPDSAFNGRREWASGEFKRVVSLWKKEFAGHEIVVASSNNGAVENVTLEIPSSEAIDPSWQSEGFYYKELASILTGCSAWALMAARLGNRANRRDFVSKFWYGRNNGKGSAEPVIRDKPVITNGFLKYFEDCKAGHSEWTEAVKKFKVALDDERRFRDARVQMHETVVMEWEVNHRLSGIGEELKGVESSVKVTEGLLDSAEQDSGRAKQEYERALHKIERHRKDFPSIWEIILTLLKSFKEWQRKKEQLEAYVQDTERVMGEAFARKAELARELSDARDIRDDLKQKYTGEEANSLNLRNQIEEDIQFMGKHFPDIGEWSKSDNTRELSSPWADREWNDSRVTVFLEALALHKAFIEANSRIIKKNLQVAMDILSGTLPEGVSPDAIESAWTTLFFVVPVISTTFASVEKMFKHFGREALGWLLIDEAGQATPQAAVGAIWRCKRVVVVGDPLQLEPIVNLPFSAQDALRKQYNVEATWLPSRTSAQAIADRVNRFGTYLKSTRGNDELIWVGSPLRVHRRCDNPMFLISNEIAYDGMMVYGTPERKSLYFSDSCWIDVQSDTSDGNWIEEEGKAVRKLLERLSSQKDIFLISPFRDVVKQLKELPRSRYRVGTVHTVQGKEADVVILVLGGNPKKPGAKDWAAEKPNLLNVAVSRAKRRLYVVGERSSWRERSYFDVLAAELPLSKSVES